MMRAALRQCDIQQAPASRTAGNTRRFLPGYGDFGCRRRGYSGQQSKEVDEMRSDVDRGSTTGKRRIKCPACACGFVAVRRTDNETERHVVEIRRNVSLGIYEGGEQVAYPKDEGYRAIDVGFLGQFPKPDDLRPVD